MKQALIVINEIKRLYAAINKSKSKYLKNDYYKNIKRLKADLKEYCGYKNFNYNELVKKYKI